MNLRYFAALYGTSAPSTGSPALEHDDDATANAA
jgi:hypothetical protein